MIEVTQDGVSFGVCSICNQIFHKSDSMRNHKKHYGTKDTCGVETYRKSLPLFK